ncbi:hypothetical protein D3C77_292910 [compost metagenome]
MNIFSIITSAYPADTNSTKDRACCHGYRGGLNLAIAMNVLLSVIIRRTRARPVKASTVSDRVDESAIHLDICNICLWPKAPANSKLHNSLMVFSSIKPHLFKVWIFALSNFRSVAPPLCIW